LRAGFLRRSNVPTTMGSASSFKARLKRTKKKARTINDAGFY